MIYVDYHAPVETIREKFEQIVKQSKHWDGRVMNLQVTEAKEQTIELRGLMSARSAGHAFDLRCEVREKLIDFLQAEHPEALPRQRSDVTLDSKAGNPRHAGGQPRTKTPNKTPHKTASKP
jgi:hypothetical protein